MHILLDGTQAAAAADEAKALQQAAGGEDLAKCAAPPPCASNMHPTHVHGTWCILSRAWRVHGARVHRCLAYLRDRIGVPRDMGQAAALSLRAHLNWAIDELCAA